MPVKENAAHGAGTPKSSKQKTLLNNCSTNFTKNQGGKIL